MIAEKMKPYVKNNSAIRMMFEEGNRLRAIYGADKVYDFSLGNPSVPAPEEGKYEPQSPKIGKFFTIGLHDRQIHDVLRNQKCKILCINDTENIGDFRQQKRNIKDSFESILPEKSAFELSYKDSGGMYDKKCD